MPAWVKRAARRGRGAMATLVGAIPIMREQRTGQLVGVSSLAGRRALPGGAPYGATKAALSTFLEGLRIDLRPMGLGVSDVQPGFVDTPLTQRLPSAIHAFATRRASTRRAQRRATLADAREAR